MITGILRVAKESIFSGLKNLTVYSLLRPEYATSFGFTEQEVETLVDMADAGKHMETLRLWYNGYLFGDSETPEQALDAAEKQLREQDYTAELRASGAQPIWQLAVAFDGKRVWVRGGGV